MSFCPLICCCFFYQAAAFTPFYRGHAHIDTRRREPWLFGEENTKLIREALRKRYMILPYLYTTVRNSFETGAAVMRFVYWLVDLCLQAFLFPKSVD